MMCTNIKRSAYTSTHYSLWYLYFQVMVECTGEAPNSATVIVQCNETGVVYSSSYIINQPRNITGILPLSQYQDCNISIVFSNDVGNSKSLVLPFG